MPAPQSPPQILRTAAPITILGVPFDGVTTAETLALIGAMIASRQPHYLATANVDFIVQALRDPELRRILFDAHLVLCDGTPILWAARWLGNPLPERVAGSDLVPQILAEAERNGWRVFFFGGTEASVAQAAANVRRNHPRLKLVDAYAPPFSPLLEMDHAAVLQRIRAAQPDVLLVALGCPKQEKWIHMHYRAAGVPVCIGVGATIDFLAGTVTRAPAWMQRSGLEWIYRLGQEPRRLFRRYATDLRIFGWEIFRQWRQLRARPNPQSPTATVTTLATPPAGVFQVLKLPAHLDAATVQAHQAAWQQALAAGADLFVDLAATEFIDSTGVGLLVRLQKTQRAMDRSLVLVAPLPAVQSALRLMRLMDLLPTADTVAAAQALVAARLAERSLAVTVNLAGGGETLVWQGEITTVNADAVWATSEAHLRRWTGSVPGVTIDIGGLRYLDSSGVRVMVRARKFGQHNDLAIKFSAPTDVVRQVIRLLRMDEFLFGPRQ